jgi:Lipocalin-like domain
MNRRSIIGLSAIIGLGLIALPRPVVSQQQLLKEQLVGTWTFVSAVETHKDGTKITDRWGPNPKGLFILASNGRFSFMISRSDIPKFASNNSNQGSADENRAVVRGMIAYIGTWSVDEASKTMTMNNEAGSFPNLVGRSQKRIITSLTGDELKYTNPVTSEGAVVEAVWKRAM